MNTGNIYSISGILYTTKLLSFVSIPLCFRKFYSTNYIMFHYKTQLQIIWTNSYKLYLYVTREIMRLKDFERKKTVQPYCLSFYYLITIPTLAYRDRKIKEKRLAH